jgi:carboxypeptidase Taq
MGGLGYFPTYTLGNINAAQLHQAANSVTEIAEATAAADYAPLLAWLRGNIHRHGGTMAPPVLMEKATGKPPSTESYLLHLKSRYL